MGVFSKIVPNVDYSLQVGVFYEIVPHGLYSVQVGVFYEIDHMLTTAYRWDILQGSTIC